MKKIFIICLFAVLCCLAFAACGDEQTSSQPTMLQIPDIEIKADTVKWQSVQNADKYEVMLNDKVYITYNNEYVLPLTDEIQSFNFKVKAVSEKPQFINSNFSESLAIELAQIAPITGFRFYYVKGGYATDHAISIYWSCKTQNILYDYFLNGVNVNSEIITEPFILGGDKYIKNSNFIVGENTFTLKAHSEDGRYLESIHTTTINKAEAPTATSLYIRNGKIVCEQSNEYEVTLYDGSLETKKEKRALAFHEKEGFLPSDTVTFNYYILDDYLQATSNPSLSKGFAITKCHIWGYSAIIELDFIDIRATHIAFYRNYNSEPIVLELTEKDIYNNGTYFYYKKSFDDDLTDIYYNYPNFTYEIIAYSQNAISNTQIVTPKWQQ